MRAPARPMATWRPPSAVWPASYRKVPARAAEKVYGWLAPDAVPTSAACADRPAENSPAGCPGNTRETGSASWLCRVTAVSYTHLRAHETDSYLVCRLLLE